MNRRYERWQREIMVLSRRLDFVLPRTVMALLVVMVLAQGLIRSPIVAHLYGGLDRSEAARRMAYEELGSLARGFNERSASTRAAGPHLTLELVKPGPTKRIKILLNGEIIASFGKASITIPVQPGDLVEVDCQEEATPVTVRVSEITADLARPQQGQYLQGQGEIRPLGRVIAKEGN